ncbi:hypothetical protein RVR_8367 [Actinacidiphila reveromycinica]|uniref:Uncharacterized protein n=1 Tax=Actinacidiphila reveromycinica TaxID=659352 RepID=A0A7U3UYH2_9ACTN|nr:hypothetical protein [Streptomyces sp. SN-593]BBB01111.1 hypothetical protein RVR_8367 [Streptomyces sp. SN-593]
MRIDGPADLTQDQIYDAIYDLLHAAPFGFDVTSVMERAREGADQHPERAA